MQDTRLVLVLWLSAVAAGHCTGASPCTCSGTTDGVSVRCRGQEGADRIRSAVSNFRSSRKWELVLESMHLDVLPDSVRNASSLRLSGVRLQRLQDDPSATWPRLYDLVVESSSVAGGLWRPLAQSPKLMHLKVSNFPAPVIGSEFREGVPPGVAYLDVRKTGTASIEVGAMGHLERLKYLLMVDMPLKEFPRSALPAKLVHLHTFILGNTQIENLHLDFFEGMPKLEVLMLNGNKMKTLDFQLFQPVESHLSHLLAENNPLVCGCGLERLSEETRRRKIKVLATCFDLATNESTAVSTLSEFQFC